MWSAKTGFSGPIRFPEDQVRSMGFPYGTLRVDNKLKLVQRVFQGHIVSGIIEFKPVSEGASGLFFNLPIFPNLMCLERD